MIKALVACRSGMGSSLLLKIKVEQICKENGFPIQIEHGNLNALIGFDGELVITMNDVVDEIKDQAPYCIGIKDIMDKEEIKSKLLDFINSRK